MTRPASVPYPPRSCGPADIVIANEVIAAIAAHAAAGAPGVTRLEPSVGGLLAGLGRTARRRLAGIDPAPVTGTGVTMSAGQVSIRVDIAVSAGQQAARTVAGVQQAVRDAVTIGTGLPVAAVCVSVLDIDLNTTARTSPARTSPARTSPAGAVSPGPDLTRSVDHVSPGGHVSNSYPAGITDPDGIPESAIGGSRIQASTAVLASVRSVPGLQPASPVRLDRARGMRWDPGILAVGLSEAQVEVQLAATRLPLPPLLDQASAAIGDAVALTRWAGRPLRLVVAALDAAALAAW